MSHLSYTVLEIIIACYLFTRINNYLKGMYKICSKFTEQNIVLMMLARPEEIWVRM